MAFNLTAKEPCQRLGVIISNKHKNCIGRICLLHDEHKVCNVGEISRTSPGLTLP